MAIATCLLCNSGSIINRQESASRTIYNCPNCGVFVLSDLIEREAINKSDELASFLMSRKITNESDTVLISFEKANLDKDYLQMTVNRIVDFFPRTFSAQMDMALKNLGHISKFPGYEIRVDDIKTAPMFYVKDQNLEALLYLVDAMRQAGFIEIKRNNGELFPFSVVVSPKGWEQLENPRPDANPRRNIFAYTPGGENNVTNQFYGAFEKVARECGYHPVSDARVHLHEKVTFELVAAIKSGDVIICDFTAHAGISYYVAALAHSLGKTCILTCHELKRKKLEFDESQYRIILWDNPEQLYLDLLSTIKALG